jgi:signal transduction histidine kinase
VRADIEAIKAASLRAAQTIKDLLALGRQGRMAKENLDINRVIKSSCANSSLRIVEEGTSRVNMIQDLNPAPLVVRGSESQLARAVDNLIRNAVEATGGNGEVVVKSAKVDVLEPWAGYECIPVGQYATLSVSDDGCGIERRDLGQVFEPFFTKKRARSPPDPAWGWPSSTASSRNTRDTSMSPARLAWEPPSICTSLSSMARSAGTRDDRPPGRRAHPHRR